MSQADAPAPSQAVLWQRETLDCLLTGEEVRRLVGLSKSAMYRLIIGKAFPRPRRLSGNCVRWRYSEILAWMDALPIAERGETSRRRASQSLT